MRSRPGVAGLPSGSTGPGGTNQQQPGGQQAADGTPARNDPRTLCIKRAGFGDCPAQRTKSDDCCQENASVRLAPRANGQGFGGPGSGATVELPLSGAGSTTPPCWGRGVTVVGCSAVLLDEQPVNANEQTNMPESSTKRDARMGNSLREMIGKMKGLSDEIRTSPRSHRAECAFSYRPTVLQVRRAG